MPEASRLPVKEVSRAEKNRFWGSVIITVAKYENEDVRACQLAEIFGISLEMITEFMKMSHKTRMLNTLYIYECFGSFFPIKSQIFSFLFREVFNWASEKSCRGTVGGEAEV
jgi:hypothetical protein